MVTNYINTKKNILNAYETFRSLIGTITGGKPSPYDASLEFLAMQEENIRTDTFLLMVVGEAKSGKSTFINAYLGEEILPMDVKQCTSSIVKICYGTRFILNATYANGRVDTISGEQEIKNFLAANAALNDDYRDIPVPAINYEILTKGKGKMPPESTIAAFIRGTSSENLYHLPFEEYARKICMYIKENMPKWKDIVLQIEIQYPFADQNLKNVTIIDTPGVNADGRIGDITDKYVENANAVIFLKPITGAALEASSFRRFLESKSADRNKRAMFLILTRVANETPDNIERIHKEALRQFPNIDKNHIIPVDSKAKLFNDKLKNLTMEEINNYLQQEETAKRLDSFIYKPWFAANGNREKFLQMLMELSRFEVMDASLHQFTHKIQYIAYQDFLTHMIKVIRRASIWLTDNVNLYREKSADPIELGYKMNNIKAELEEMTLKINKTVEDIAISYTKAGGYIDERVNGEMIHYTREISKINPNEISSLDELEKISFQKIDALTEFGNILQRSVIQECDKALVSLSNKNAIQFASLKPDITKETFQQVRDVFRNSPNAQETYTYETGLTFTKTKKECRFSQSKYYNLVKSDIERRITTLKNQIIYELKHFVSTTTTAYRNELARNVEIKRNELNTISQEKQTAEEIQAKIKELEIMIFQLNMLEKDFMSLLEGIKKHV